LPIKGLSQSLELLFQSLGESPEQPGGIAELIGENAVDADGYFKQLSLLENSGGEVGERFN
jgi:hypothetical protein